MPKLLPRAYKMEPTAPTGEWSAVTHGGRTVCVGERVLCLNLPAALFREHDASLADVLSPLEPLSSPGPPASALVALRRLAAMLVYLPESCPSGASAKKRRRDPHGDLRSSMGRRTFGSCAEDGSTIVQERFVFLLEEVAAASDPQSVVCVRLWKVPIDSTWRENRVMGLHMVDGLEGAPTTPTELLGLYSNVGAGGHAPLLGEAGVWLERHGTADWAARSLLQIDEKQCVFSGNKMVPMHHPLSPELVLSATRPLALQAGTPLATPPSPPQSEAATYLRWMAAATAAAGSQTDVFERAAKRPPWPQPLRFPAGARVYGLQPLSGAAAAALPAALLARLAAGRLQPPAPA